MGEILVHGRDGEFIKSAMEMLLRFSEEIGPGLTEWEKRLKKDPVELDAIERDVRNQYLRGAGLMIAVH